jgi:beta-alanine--pyruvate transaminase
VHVKAFFEENLLIRYTGDIIALSPPLIVEKAQIDRIVDGLRRVLSKLD